MVVDIPVSIFLPFYRNKQSWHLRPTKESDVCHVNMQPVFVLSVLLVNKPKINGNIKNTD